jgi:hypothetical protein
MIMLASLFIEEGFPLDAFNVSLTNSKGELEVHWNGHTLGGGCAVHRKTPRDALDGALHAERLKASPAAPETAQPAAACRHD